MKNTHRNGCEINLISKMNADIIYTYFENNNNNIIILFKCILLELNY